MWTKDQILEHLNYDAETGKFTFKDGVQAGANIKGYVYLHLGKLIPAHRVVWFLETGVWPEETDKCIGWYVGGTQADALDLCEELHNAAIKQGTV